MDKVGPDFTTSSENNYKPAIDYVSGYNSNIDILSNQLNYLTGPEYQPSLLSAISGVHGQLNSFNAFQAILPIATSLDYNSQAWDLSRSATLAYTGLTNIDTVNSLAAWAPPNYANWVGEIGEKTNYGPVSVFSNAYIGGSRESLTKIFGEQNLSAFSLQSNLAKATTYSLYTEKSLSTFPWANIGGEIGLTESLKGKIGDSYLGLSTDYNELLKTFGANPKSYVELSPSLTKLAPVECYTGATLLRVISTKEELSVGEELLNNEIQYENEYSLNEYLPQIDPGLLKMWKGAVETFRSPNSDKERQVTASLRELFGHVMRLLAPDDAIKNWTSVESFYHEGRPTRQARLQYICRNISSKPFNKFIEKDIQATLEFINIFQAGTHSIESGFSPKQLIALKCKAETTLKFILEIEFSANRVE